MSSLPLFCLCLSLPFLCCPICLFSVFGCSAFIFCILRPIKSWIFFYLKLKPQPLAFFFPSRFPSHSFHRCIFLFVSAPRTCCAGIPLNFPSSLYPCLIIFTHFTGLWWLGWMSRGKTKKSRVVEYLRRVNWHLFRQNKNIPSSFTEKLLINNPSICYTFTDLSHLSSSFIPSVLLCVLSCTMWHFINSKSLRHLFADTASNFVDNKPDWLQGSTGRGRCSDKVWVFF